MSDLPEEQLTPVEVLMGGFVAVNEGNVTSDTYLTAAFSSAMAEAATPESVAQLVALFHELADAAGGSCLLLAAALERHASALNNLGRSQLALLLYDAVRSIFEDYAPVLPCAEFHSNRAIVLRNLGQWQEVVAAFQSAIDLVLPLIDNDSGFDPVANDLFDNLTVLASGLVADLMNRADALLDQGKLKEAVTGYGQVLQVVYAVNEDGNSPLFADDLAQAHLNRAKALDQLIEWDEAVVDYEAAITILRRRIEQDGCTELINDLASALMSWANTLMGLNRPEEAKVGYEQARALQRRRIAQNGHGDPA